MPSCLCSYKMTVRYSLNSLPIAIPKGHCRVHKSPVNPMYSPLTHLLMTDFNINLLLTPVSPERSLSLGSHIKVLHIRFPRQHLVNILIFEMCHVSSRCANTDCLQTRLATISHVSARADYPLLDYFAFLDILHLRQFFLLFFNVAFPALSCTLLLLSSVSPLCRISLHLYSWDKPCP
jgi:hypothetical protein